MASSNAPPPPPRNITLSVTGVHTNITCYGFHVWAEDFLAASRSYGPVARKGSFVQHFLCCQSLELSLKAFLSLKGVSRRDLSRKPFGHQLSSLLDEAVRRGLNEFVEIAPDDISLAKVADQWYDTPGGKRFQYFGLLDALTAFNGSPDFTALDHFAARMQSEKLRDAVLRA